MAAGRLLRTIWLSWLALPSRRELLALDLLVVLELELEELDHLDGRAGGAGDGDARVAVGREDLLDVAVADEVARRWPAGRPPSPRRRRSGWPRRWCRASGSRCHRGGRGTGASNPARRTRAAKSGPGSSCARKNGSVTPAEATGEVLARSVGHLYEVARSDGVPERVERNPGERRYSTASPRARADQAVRSPSGLPESPTRPARSLLRRLGTTLPADLIVQGPGARSRTGRPRLGGCRTTRAWLIRGTDCHRPVVWPSACSVPRRVRGRTRPRGRRGLAARASSAPDGRGGVLRAPSPAYETAVLLRRRVQLPFGGGDA